MNITIMHDDCEEHEIQDVTPAEAMDYLALCKAVPINLDYRDNNEVFSRAQFDGQTLYIFTKEEV